jgi:hypothetical protein
MNNKKIVPKIEPKIETKVEKSSPKSWGEGNDTLRVEFTNTETIHDGRKRKG